MKQLLFVFVGGGIGSVLRFLLGKFLNSPDSSRPLGTLLANIIGSLLIGLVLGYSLKLNTLTKEQTLLVATGFCGGLTTFSTFMYENQLLIKSGDYLNFIIYTIISFTLGLLAVLLGGYLVKFF